MRFGDFHNLKEGTMVGMIPHGITQVNLTFIIPHLKSKNLGESKNNFASYSQGSSVQKCYTSFDTLTNSYDKTLAVNLQVSFLRKEQK